jgi:nitroreductase
MDALTALHSRNSVNLLCEPAPTEAQLQNILRAGLRACDHKNLTPWRFLIIEGDARHRFGELMVSVKATIAGGVLDPVLAAKLRSKPLRAPTIVAVVAKIQNHPKVPEIEQILSAGGSAQMMMVAAHAQNIGAIWRSGSMMFQAEMRAGLGLAETDHIIGFIYLGTPLAVKALAELNTSDYTSRWSGE